VKQLLIGPGGILAIGLAILLLVGCRDSSPPRSRAETGPGDRLDPVPWGKIRPPITVSLALANQPSPGGHADLDLTLESELPESCTVEVELRLPDQVPLEGASRTFRHSLAPRGRASVPFRLRIPDEGRYVIEAVATWPNPEGLPAATGSTLVIDLGAAEKPEREPVLLKTGDGRSLSVTVTE